MRISFSITKLIIIIVFLPILCDAQEDGLLGTFIRTVLKPYEGGLDSYLEANKKDETERRESFYSLFTNEKLQIFNDIPNCADGGNLLSVKRYCQIARSVGNGKKIVVQMDYADVLMCTSLDTNVFVKKLFIIDTSKIEIFLKFKIRYFPNVYENKFKILSIEKVIRPSDIDNDRVPDECDVCKETKGDINYSGCRLVDRDGDGILDNDDGCPESAGSKELNGCPDKDKDGVPDKDDKCPDKKGTIEMKGCPDEDEDGIPEYRDDCPQKHGSKALNGCPDKDKDDIPDNIDKCPNDFGLPEYSGCPKSNNNLIDRDGDGTPDEYDSCPDLIGTKKLQGCPDSDEDGIPNKDDTCPYQRGPKEFFGCPDSDSDGISDNIDKCIHIKGSITCKGCPDIDNDGISDDIDKCPTIYGIKEFRGCPDTTNVKIDTDGDGLLNEIDNCPNTAGPPNYLGCPYPPASQKQDSDGDGLIDEKDKCPNVAGIPEYSGCPNPPNNLKQDSDGDGITDDVDKCPTLAGVLENLGCPFSQSGAIQSNMHSIDPYSGTTRVGLGVHLDYGIIGFVKRPENVENGQRYHFRAGVTFDVHNTQKVLGFVAEANYLHQTFQFENYGVIDSFSINNFELPVMLRLGVGEDKNSFIGVGAAYNKPTTIKRKTNFGFGSDNSTDQVIPHYFSIISMAKIGWDIGGFTLKFKYDLGDVLNKDYPIDLLSSQSGNNFDLRFLQISLGIEWMFNLKK